MKHEFPLSLSKDTGASHHLTVDRAEAIEASIARLIEENATLRLLADQLSSQLDRTRGLAHREGQQSSQ